VASISLDHEENAETGKSKLSDLSRRIRLVAYSSPSRYLMSALEPIADQSLLLRQVRKVPKSEVAVQKKKPSEGVSQFEPSGISRPSRLALTTGDKGEVAAPPLNPVHHIR
jgi:hypothetical protein